VIAAGKKPTACLAIRWTLLISLLGSALLGQSVTAELQPLFPPDMEMNAGTEIQQSKGQIIVGVRPDARPFSYRTGARHDERILPDFGGYMIEICRRVLSDMTTGNGPFRDYTVVTRPVNASNRFEMLMNERIDILCGPDSITPNRLGAYNVSHPVFLSGLTWVTVRNEDFPQRAHCQPILGLLARTTAETVGLQVLADRNELFRFDSALEQYLTIVSKDNVARKQVNMLSEMEAFTSHYFSKSRPADGSDKKWEEPVDSRQIVTEECPDGFESGPVVQFSSHDDGLEALCNRDIFYYLGDRDILKSRVAGMPNCNFDVKSKTMTREAYGVFFRKTRRDLSQAGKPGRSFPDSALQAEFNNVLLRLMQESANILDYEFRREFAPEAATADLQRFFDSFKFASHHIREE